MKHAILLIGGFLLINLGLTIMGFGLFIWKFSPKIPSATFLEPKNQGEAREQDLDYLLNLTKIDRSFSKEEIDQFQQYIEQLRTKVTTMSDVEFAMSIAEAAAITKNGHTNASIAHIVDTLNSLPLRFFWFADGLHIVRAHANHADLIGARVISYDNESPEELVTKLAKYLGGNAPYRWYNSVYLFASPAAMNAVNLAKNADHVVLFLELSDGETRELSIFIEQNPTETMRLRDHILPKHSKEELESGNDWQFLNPERISLAHYSMHPDKTFWEEDLADGGIYIRLRLIMNTDDSSLSNWLSSIKKRLSKKPANYLVLDLRSNPGGDYMKSRVFAKAISKFVKPEGRIYTLTDEGTFSAAVVTAAFTKHAAGEKGKIVGSAMGDDEQFWAEGGAALTLPNSGLKVSVATAYHDWENDCQDWRRCYWPNIILGVAAGKLEPDIIAPLTFEDYSKGIDTTMQAVFTQEAKSQPDN